MKSVKRYSVIVSATALLLGMSLFAQAAEAPQDIVKYRQAVMKSQGSHMAAAAAIIMGKVSFPDQLAGHVNALEATTKDIPNLFPQGSDGNKTEALKEVWTKNDEFRKHAKDAQEKAAALAQAVAAGDTQSYGKHFKDLADSCKSCHKDFRKKEEKK